MREEKNNQAAKQERQEDTRKLYVTPQLTMYGNIEQITHGDVSGEDDGLGGGQSA